MTTAAAIDRLIHHAEILELNTESYRIQTAKTKRKNALNKDHPEEEKKDDEQTKNGVVISENLEHKKEVKTEGN